MSKTRVESPTGYYHVIQRGTGKQMLFEDQSDYLRYLNRLVEYGKDEEFELAAYCLMPNHTHLLIRSNSEALGKVFHRFGTSYSRYFNAKYQHAGHVFQGRYLSEPITDEGYLRACVRYIHNNPVKAGYCKRDEYQWSSYNEFIQGSGIAETAGLLAALGGVDAFVHLCESVGNDSEDFLDYGNFELRSASGLDVIRRELGGECKSGLVVKGLDRQTRNKILVELKGCGLSNKQIELLTGVSKSIVKRA